MSPKMEAGDSQAQTAFGTQNPGQEEDGPLCEDYIEVKLYFYGPDKATRTRMFPQELYGICPSVILLK